MQRKRKQPLWRHDKRRGYLVGLDYRTIFKKMNDPEVPRGHAAVLAEKYNTSVGNILAIGSGRAGLRHLGDLVQPMASGLRGYLPENRNEAKHRRGITVQKFVYRRLKPVEKEEQHAIRHTANAKKA